MWLADSAAGVDASLPQWFQAGGVVALLSLLVWALISGRLVSGSLHRSQIEERDRRISQLEAENRDQTIFLRDQAAPLLTRTQDVLVKILEERAWDERQRREKT